MTHPLREAALERARVLLGLNRPQEALNLAGGYLSAHPQSVSALLIVGFALIEVGRTTEAVRVGEQALAAGPQDWRCWHLHALALSSERRWDESMSSASRMLELAPNSARAQSEYAVVALQAGRTGDARSAVERSLQINPDDPDNLVLLAKIALIQRRPDDASTHLASALAIAPDHDDARRVLASLQPTKEQAAVELARMLGSAPADGQTEAYFEMSASGLLVRPAMLVLGCCLAVLAAGILGTGLFGLQADVPGAPVLGIVLQAVVIALGILGVRSWASHADVELGGLGRTLMRNRLGTGPLVTMAVGFLGLAALLLVGGWLVGVVWGDPAGPIIVLAAAVCAFTGAVLAGIMSRLVRATAKFGYGVLIPLGVVLCAPGFAIMVVAMAVGFVLMVGYIVLAVLTGEKLFALPAWLRNDKKG